MSITTYTLSQEKILHDAKIDFTKRNIPSNVYIVQYDAIIPVIGVQLYIRGSLYTLPDDELLEVKVRWGKKDSGIYVYKSLLGCNEARNIVYLEVDSDMTKDHGMFDIIIELSFGNGSKAGSSPITMIIEPNPIQEMS